MVGGIVGSRLGIIRRESAGVGPGNVVAALREDRAAGVGGGGRDGFAQIDFRGGRGSGTGIAGADGIGTRKSIPDIAGISGICAAGRDSRGETKCAEHTRVGRDVRGSGRNRQIACAEGTRFNQAYRRSVGGIDRCAEGRIVEIRDAYRNAIRCGARRGKGNAIGGCQRRSRAGNGREGGRIKCHAYV